MKTAGDYRHLFFDLDETLWDFKRNSYETLHELLGDHSLTPLGVERAFFIERYHYHNDYYWDLFRKGKISRDELRSGRWKKTLSEFNISDDSLAQKLSEQYLHRLPWKKNLFADTLRVLDYLKARYTLHIITNGFEEVQYRKIETSGLAKYFTHVITSERAGSQKPQREIFLFAFDLTGATVRNSLFIGDSIEADIHGAKAIGMDHILFNPEKKLHAENIGKEISSLSELLTLL
jgi:putative hydrolase of the HAD superfamily